MEAGGGSGGMDGRGRGCGGARRGRWRGAWERERVARLARDLTAEEEGTRKEVFRGEEAGGA